MKATDAIPVIDLSDALTAGSPRGQQVAAQLRAAAKSSGFFCLSHHGVDSALIQRQFEIAHELLALPAATRNALSMRLSPILRGFENLGEQTLDAASRPDLKESFYCGIAYPPDHPCVVAGLQTYGHNQWPAELPEVPAQCKRYIQAMLGLSQRLMQLLALSLDLRENHFDADLQDPMATLRMVRYPAHPADADELLRPMSTHRQRESMGSVAA